MSVLRLLESVACTHASELDADAARRQFRVLSRVRAWIDAREAELAARLTELAPGGSAAVAALDVAGNGRMTKRETRLLMDRAEALQDLPEFGQALHSGTVTAAHLDEVVSALKKAGEKADELKEHEGALVQSAIALPHDRFAQQVNGLLQRLNSKAAADEADWQRRSTHLKSWTDSNGMIHIRGAFDTERGTVLLGRLENEMERQFHSGSACAGSELLGVSPNDHLRAMALLDLVGAGAAGASGTTGAHGVPGATVPPSAVHAEIVVIIDQETLCNGLHDSSVCRTSRGAALPVVAVRRLACQAQILPVVMNSDGVPIDVGRQNRLATARQRRLIFAMYRTCAVPDCDVGVAHCVPHHIEYWENGGRTDLNNLVPLCSRHHHAAHEGGWGLRLDSARTLHVTLPDGRVVSRPLERR